MTARWIAFEPITSCATRRTSSAVTASSPASSSSGSIGPFQHLAPQAEQDQPVRAFRLQYETALREVPRLLELVRRHGLVGERAELLDDHLHRFVDTREIDARLRVEGAGVGVGVVEPV